MSVNNTNCCVFGCHSKKGKNKELSFHSFPQKNKSSVYIENRFGLKEKIDNHKAWMLQLKMEKPPTKFLKVCSLHFRKEDFILPGFPTKRPRLKSIAVPSQNLPKSRKVYCKVKQPQIPRGLKDSETESHMMCENKSNSRILTYLEHEPQKYTVSDSEATAVYALCYLSEIPSISKILVAKRKQESQVSSEDFIRDEMLPRKDQETQVATRDLLGCFTDKIKTDKQLYTMTGIPNYQLFNSIVSMCCHIYSKSSTKHKLKLEDCIMLCFMKMKNAFSYAALSVLFGNVTESTCCSIFHETLAMLATILKHVIYLPPIEEMKLNIPTCFEHFQNVRIVIDCIEIPVQKAKCVKKRRITYSNHKKTHTMKFMTGVTPAGLIAFISKGYGGEYSDISIFEQSDLLEKLDMFRDEIMADKGFLVKHFTETHFVKFIQPSFLNNKQKLMFLKNEILENQKIAKARVHVERVNQRIKIFEIFKKPLPISLWPRVDDIFTIACAIVNLTNSRFDDTKFM